MTKTLTEQWRDGKLPEGYYYVLYADQSDHYPSCDTEDYDDIDYWNGCEWHYDNDPVVDVIALVPSYEEWHKVKDLGLRPDYTDHIEKWEDCAKLTKQLAIATKALKETKEKLLHVELSGLDGDNRQKMYDLMFEDGVIDKALKEMEGVR